MADGITLSAGSGDGAVIMTDDMGATGHIQIVKLAHGALDSATLVSTVSGLPVQGTVTANLSATDNAVLDTIELNTDSLAVVGGGTEAAALRVTIANNSTGVVSVDDNGGALTVDGTVTAELSATDNAVLDAIALAVGTEGDALADGILIQGDDGVDRTNILVDAAGHLQVDIVSGAGSGGTASDDDADFTAGTTAGTPAMGVYESVPSAVTDGDLGIVGITSGRRLKTSATVDAALPAGTNAIGKLAANSGVDIGDVDILSVPAPLNVVGGGAEATALRVTIANDSTGVLSVDDNAGSLTVDGTVTANLSATDNAVLDSIQAAVEIIDNAISGTEMQVDVVASLPAGTNNIGDVDIASALPAGTNLIGVAAAGLSTSAIYNGTTALTPKFAAIAAASSGDNTLVAAVANKKIRVLQVFLVAAAAVTVRFESGASGTALTGQAAIAANGGYVLPFSPVGWFETGSNTLLNLELSAAVSVAGGLVYVEV